MRRGRVLIYVALILIFGLVALFVVWQRIILPNQQPPVAQTTPTPPPLRVVALAQPVTAGTVLEQPFLTTVPWQQSALVPGMFTEAQMAELIGRPVKYDLPNGTILMDNMLLKQDEALPQTGSPWALSIPQGQVAISIPITRLSSISYAPRPGDHVNVIVTMLFVDIDTDFQSILPNKTGVVVASGPPDPTTGTRNPLTVDIAAGTYGRTIIDPVLGQAVFVLPGESQRPRMVSHMLLQDVMVLYTGAFPLESAQTTTPEAQEAQPTPVPEGQVAQPVIPDVITLIVYPQDAVALNYLLNAQSHSAAQLSLVLRNYNDKTTVADILPVTLQYLLEKYQIPVPARLPYSLNPRIDTLGPVTAPAAQAPAQ